MWCTSSAFRKIDLNLVLTISKAMSTFPGMMASEALGCHTLHRPLVGSDEGEWMLEARVSAVSEDEVPWRRVDSTPVQWAINTLEYCTDPGQHTCSGTDGQKLPAG